MAVRSKPESSLAVWRPSPAPAAPHAPYTSLHLLFPQEPCVGPVRACKKRMGSITDCFYRHIKQIQFFKGCAEGTGDAFRAYNGESQAEAGHAVRRLGLA